MLPYRLVFDSQYKGWKHLFYAPYNSRVRTLNRWPQCKMKTKSLLLISLLLRVPSLMGYQSSFMADITGENAQWWKKSSNLILNLETSKPQFWVLFCFSNAKSEPSTQLRLLCNEVRIINALAVNFVVSE